MNIAFNKRLMIAWAIVSSITLVYLWVDSGDHGERLTESRVVTSLAIVMALVKVRIILREFMEVRCAPPVLRRLTDAWVVLVAAILLGSYFIGLTTR